MSIPHEPEPVPSISELRAWFTRSRPRIGTGWPALDVVTEGIPIAQTTAVHGPQRLRLQILARMAAWAAGEGFSVVIASRAVTTEELWLAVGAGGLGLPPRALLETRAHDTWIDDRLRVLDLRVLGGSRAPEKLDKALADRVPSLLIVDDYLGNEYHWAEALGAAELDVNAKPRELSAALVLGGGSMESFSDFLDRGVLTVRVVPDDDGSRTRITCYDGSTRRNKVVLLRDGYLEPPRPDQPMLRRPGATNIWQERTGQDISDFARALGADLTELVWEQGHDVGPD
ncbi:hypothetical protein [Ornithinimicrobium cryptoxanthini]|uniref:hypothetical protein n=1 Tax=Ornithinimicrobium cryptoxanthini TaxID=2934161 RepID=UPI0021193E3A|nr:hypothetical protein [Ornithinimicrobium cryptoxanthini]